MNDKPSEKKKVAAQDARRNLLEASRMIEALKPAGQVETSNDCFDPDIGRAWDLARIQFRLACAVWVKCESELD